MTDLRTLQKRVFTTAKDKGFHQDLPFDRDGMLVRLVLIQTELMEAAQVIKRHGISQPMAFVEELADAAIRILDLCEGHAFSLADYVSDIHIPSTARLSELSLDRYRLLIELGLASRHCSMAFEYAFIRYELAFDALAVLFKRLERMAILAGPSLYDWIAAKNDMNRQRPHRYGTPQEGKQ